MIPKPVGKSAAILGAEYPVGLAVTVVLVVYAEVDPLLRQYPVPKAFSQTSLTELPVSVHSSMSWSSMPLQGVPEGQITLIGARWRPLAAVPVQFW